MGIFQQFPYSNFHEMNLDQIIKIMREMQDEWANTKTEWASYKEFIDNYFENLDVSEEVLAALRTMAGTGELNAIIDPTIASETADWLSEHITQPTTPVVDNSLTVTGAAADAKVTGNRIRAINDSNDVLDVRSINVLYGDRVDGYYISEAGNIGTNATYSYYFPCRVESDRYYNAHSAGAVISFYDKDMQHISGITLGANINKSFKTPALCKYISYSYKTADVNPYVELATEQPLTYYDNSWKKLDYHVSLLLEHFTPVIVPGKNMFNKWNIISGCSFDYSSAGAGDELWTNASYSYCPDFIPAKGSTTYITNYASIIAEYDETHHVITTHNLTAITVPTTFTTDASTKFIRIGVPNTGIDLIQVEEGSAVTNYEPFRVRLKYGATDANIHTVKQDGSGDYVSISDAISNAINDDIIIVYPGTYTESVKAYNKRVHIVGVNRAKCILTYSGLDYANPPLEMAAGSVSNMTIKATNSGSAGMYNAYCVHIDNDNEANQALSFTNVDFINEVHQAVGIGLRPHFTLTFDACRFISEDQGALYCHDWETDDIAADKTGQKLIVRSCSLSNNSASKATIMLQSQELVTAGAEALFISNVVVNKAAGSLISMTLWDGRTLTNTNFMGSSDWVLSDSSELNTLATINYAKITNYRPIGALLNRVTDITGGFVQVGQIVYVNVKVTAAVTHSSTPGILSGVPAPLTGTAVLTGIRADSGLSSSMDNAIMVGVNNTNIYTKEITAGETYYITGSYIAV